MIFIRLSSFCVIPSMSLSSFAREVGPNLNRHKIIVFHFPFIMQCTSSKGQVYSSRNFILITMSFPLPANFGRRHKFACEKTFIYVFFTLSPLSFQTIYLTSGSISLVNNLMICKEFHQSSLQRLILLFHQKVVS